MLAYFQKPKKYSATIFPRMSFPFKFSNHKNSARKPLLALYRNGSDDEDLDIFHESNCDSSDTMYTANSHVNSFATSDATVGTKDNFNETRINVLESQINLEQNCNDASDTGDGNKTIVAGLQRSSGSLGPRIERVDSAPSRMTVKLSSALFYAITSFLITVINKIVLTSYAFPSYNLLGVGQMLAIILILGTANSFKYVKLRKNSLKNPSLWMLAIFYLANLITGLGGTKYLPLPMFIALRRVSSALIAFGEFLLLNVYQTVPIVFTITTMIVGSFIAALSDLAFNAVGYTLVMLNNIFTASNMVYTKKTVESKEVNKYEVLYYSALITILPLILISFFTNDKETLLNYPHWKEVGFLISFFLSCVMAFLLMLSTVLCTHYNSALTTSIVGTLKNILTTYAGFFVGGDYMFSILNFVGLNISLAGSLAYTYIVFISKSRQRPRHGLPQVLSR